MEPLVTVLISSYNQGAYISECLNSVLNQSYKNLQVIVVDDGSQDDTLEILQSCEDERVTALTTEKNTAFRLYEIAEKEIQGKYVAELASDDRWTLDKIKKQVDFLESHGSIGAVFSWCEVLTPDLNEKERLEKIFNVQNREMHEWFRELIVEGNKFNNPSVMFRTEVFQKYGGYRFQYRQLQDLELWLRMLPNETIYVMPEKLTYYMCILRIKLGILVQPQWIIWYGWIQKCLIFFLMFSGIQMEIFLIVPFQENWKGICHWKMRISYAKNF